MSPGLADEVLSRLGSPRGPDDLVEAMGRNISMGNTAKMLAIKQGRIPFGANPEEMAACWLETPSPDLSWSCWPIGTLCMALLDVLGHETDIFLTRRVDASTGPTDFHPVIRVDGSSWVDPSLWSGPVATNASFLRHGRHMEMLGTDQGEGNRWNVFQSRLTSLLSYRLIGSLTPGDVEAFCRISTTFSGVPNVRLSYWLTRDGICGVKENDRGAQAKRYYTARHEVLAHTVDSLQRHSFESAIAGLLELPA
jgi:hypothetical protein